MIPHSYTSCGIVLGRKDYAEADRIVSLFSRDYGKIFTIAKSVRKPKSKKRGHIEIFSLVDFQAVKGKGLDLITEVEIVDDFKEIRKDLSRVSLAYYFVEVIGKITHENEKNQHLFDLAVDYLNRLKHDSGLKSLRFDFVSDVLVLMGYWPEGKRIDSPDSVLEDVIERQISSIRVGKRMLQ